jgi:hypothetical protein
MPPGLPHERDNRKEGTTLWTDPSAPYESSKYEFSRGFLTRYAQDPPSAESASSHFPSGRPLQVGSQNPTDFPYSTQAARARAGSGRRDRLPIFVICMM